MLLTPEQQQIGKDNFADVSAARNEADLTRRDAIKAAVAAGTGLGAAYFGYGTLKGERVRTAFIGTGDEGNVLINEHPTDYMDLVAIADLRPANLERTFTGSHPVARRGLKAVLGSAAQDVKAYSNHLDLLKDKDALGLEAVVIAVPLNQHARVAIECMEAGLHVLCEKLMAKNVTQCKEMIQKADEKGLMLAVGHQRHYSVLYDNAAYLTGNGLLGDIKFIRAQWHRNNSFPNSDAWQKYGKAHSKDKEALKELEKSGRLEKDFGYTNHRKLIDWRLYEETGGGLMAELGSHQLDAASIFLGKVHPIAVQGYGGKNFFGMEGVGPKSAWGDNRDIDDQVFVTFEFPGKTHPKLGGKNERDVSVVTYSSMNTNRWEPYGEAVFGSRGTLWMKTEKEALLYKEASKSSPGGVDQRIYMVSKAGAGPVLDSYETSAPAAQANGPVTEKVSRGYREEMEHFCYCIRTGKDELRCNGTVAMADAIMALTSNIAMTQHKRIEFKDEWFDPKNPACPEEDHKV